MNKADLIAEVAGQTGLTKRESEQAVNAALDSISAALETGGRIHLVNFGTFEVKHRIAREGFNPKTGERIMVSASHLPVFKPAKALRHRIAKGNDAD